MNGNADVLTRQCFQSDDVSVGMSASRRVVVRRGVEVAEEVSHVVQDVHV